METSYTAAMMMIHLWRDFNWLEDTQPCPNHEEKLSSPHSAGPSRFTQRSTVVRMLMRLLQLLDARISKGVILR